MANQCQAFPARFNILSPIYPDAIYLRSANAHPRINTGEVYVSRSIRTARTIRKASTWRMLAQANALHLPLEDGVVQSCIT